MVHDLKLDISYWATAHSAHSTAGVVAFEGYILPVLDPDAATGFTTLWDTLVPKDTDTEVVDLDVGATDTTPFYEPGEPDFSNLLDIGLQPERIYRNHRVLTPANGGSISTARDPATPFNMEWVQGGSLRVRIKRRLRVRQPSVMLFGMANPSMDDVTTSLAGALAESEWGQVKYMSHVLERAMLHLFGVTEPGAETPWEEATALLKLHLEPDVFESSAGKFDPQTFNIVCEGMVDHSVVGEIASTAISTD